jgi:hypothetical protein
VRVIVTTTSSRAMRSSIETSPSNGMIRVAARRPTADDLGELVRDDLPLPLRLGQDVLQVGDLDLDLRQLVDDLLALQCGSRRSCMSRIAVAWISSISSSSIRPLRASSTSASAGSAR